MPAHECFQYCILSFYFFFFFFFLASVSSIYCKMPFNSIRRDIDVHA
jgi:hypothetical protein